MDGIYASIVGAGLVPALGMGRAYMGRFVGNSPVRRGEGGGPARGGPLWSPAVPFHFPCNLKNLPVKALVGTLSGGQVTRHAPHPHHLFLWLTFPQIYSCKLVPAPSSLANRPGGGSE